MKKPQSRHPRRLRPAVAFRLPHEHDESPETGGEPRADIAIAEKDVREGRVDTDNYTRMRDIGEAGLRKRR